MKYFLGSLLFLLLCAGEPALADRYIFDKSHTTILFFIDHIGFSRMVGNATGYDGQFTFDPAKPEASTVDITLRPDSIRTSSELLDQGLQGGSFFNTAQFPQVHFVSTHIRVTGANSGELTGNLTLLGTTKPITLQVHFNKAAYHPLTQDYVAGFSAEGKLNRSDFGMTYLIPMVGDEVRLLIEAEGIDLDRKKAEAIKKRGL